jgi:hypothetical protein
MTKDELKAVLERLPTCPEDRQQQLAEVAPEIKADLAGDQYEATPEELAAIDQRLVGEAATEEKINGAFALFRQK